MEECPFCDGSYKTEKGLGNHIRQKHPEEYESWKADKKAVSAAEEDLPSRVLHFLLSGPQVRTLDGIADHFGVSAKEMAAILKSCEKDGTVAFHDGKWWAKSAAWRALGRPWG